jgi:hypothetical protein
MASLFAVSCWTAIRGVSERRGSLANVRLATARDRRAAADRAEAAAALDEATGGGVGVPSMRQVVAAGGF